MKTPSPWTFAVFALAWLAWPPSPAHAQQAVSPRAAAWAGPQLPEHLAPDAMSVADKAALDARMGELAESARIYGYNIREGDWAYQQTLCAPMPETILLHYFRKFPDGTESLFTAAVPRGAGRIRIVPVLYRNATPFLPAPKNPRNYALFNELVPRAIAGRDVAPNGNPLQLAACYAELTGGRPDIPVGRETSIAIAGEPLATIHLNPQERTTSVTFAGREGPLAYRIWSVSLNQDGRVIAAGSEERAVNVAGTVQQSQPSTAIAAPRQSAPTEISPQTPQETSLQASEPPAISAVPVANSANVSAQPHIQPGWKLISNPSQPVSQIIPPAPPPPEKIVPEPPDPWSKSAPASQPPQ